jgi:hypothetical protein
MKHKSSNLDWTEIDRIADSLGVLPDARRKWRERHAIPFRWQLEIIAALKKSGRDVSPSAFKHIFDSEAA